jgi:hypothetical protein
VPEQPSITLTTPTPSPLLPTAHSPEKKRKRKKKKRIIRMDIYSVVLEKINSYMYSASAINTLVPTNCCIDCGWKNLLI